MQLPAPLDEEGVVGHVLGERVLEHVGQLGEEPALEDQLERGELPEEVVTALPDLREALHQTPRELTADHRGELERSLGGLGEAVDAGGDHVLDRARNGQRGQRSRQSEAPLHAADRPLSSSDFTSSST